jgi:transcriptional regulator with XRE-family HTH domain
MFTSNMIRDKMFLMSNTLSVWLNAEIATRRWSQSDLARKSGLNRSVINKILSESSKPTPETCLALADALKIPVIQIYRITGLLPPEPKEDPLVQLITYLSEKLPTEEDKQDAVEYMRLRLRIAEERGKHDPIEKKRARKT